MTDNIVAKITLTQKEFEITLDALYSYGLAVAEKGNTEEFMACGELFRKVRDKHID